MKVKILVGMEGPTTSRKRGEIHDVEDAEALRLIAAGYAERVGPVLVPASASLAPPETAMLPAPKPRRVRAIS